jgi:transaldolase / glucose-6-phosphate isomerase
VLPSHTISAETLQEAWRREMQELSSAGTVRRLWTKDETLWPYGKGEKRLITDNLNWLDLPDQIGPYMMRAAALAATTEREGFRDVVFIAMGDSNLAAETVAQSVSQTVSPQRLQRFFLLDSTDPAAIQRVSDQVDLDRTVFVFASKSGKRIETHALLLYFLNRLRMHKMAEPGRRFVAVTEDGSYLSELATNYDFLGIFLDPPGIKGRYSSLIHFGLLLSAVWRLDPQELVMRAKAMRELCMRAPDDGNPAAELAAFLAAAEASGNNKLLLVSSKGLQASTYRIAQLVGASTSKCGQGFIPVCGGLPGASEGALRGCVAAVLKMRGTEDLELATTEAVLRRHKVPTLTVEMNGPEDLGSEMFQWEIATALACSLLEVNPFDEPDVQEGRERVSALLDEYVRKRMWPARTARVREKGIELYAEGEMRQHISTLSMAEALRTFLEAMPTGGYLAIITFASSGGETDAALGRIREYLALKYGIPVLLSSGPRYLRYFEQVYKGGPDKGLFLMLTSESAADVAIPGAGYTFGQLQMGLALADFESLEVRRKLAMRLHLTQGLEQGLAEIEQTILKL